MLVTILIFILVLGLLIFVHELGHFLTARRNGITCHEFGFGFPPRLVGAVKDPDTGKWKIVWGRKHYTGNNTLYSFNWVPLGGFVRIKGEDGVDKADDSFGSKSAWIRFKVLFAGVFMNFVLAWVLIAIGFMIGIPQSKETILSKNAEVSEARVQVLLVEQDSPAQEMGIGIGDVITDVCAPGGHRCVVIATNEDLQNAVTERGGEEIFVRVERGEMTKEFTGQARAETPEGQGALGIQIDEVVIVKYPMHEALWWSIGATATMIMNIFIAFGVILWGLVSGAGVTADLAGPVGIAALTGQVTQLGASYLLQFMALLSVNLGIINALPIPALDGGRILFLIIEKIKGRPVSRKAEGIAHSIGFTLLILLMIVVTFRDFIRFDVVDRIKGLFM